MSLKLRITFGALMSLVLTTLMTCWITYINIGLTPTFLTSWFKAFQLAYPAAFIIAFFISPHIMKLAIKIVGSKD